MEFLRRKEEILVIVIDFEILSEEIQSLRNLRILRIDLNKQEWRTRSFIYEKLHSKTF